MLKEKKDRRGEINPQDFIGIPSVVEMICEKETEDLLQEAPAGAPLPMEERMRRFEFFHKEMARLLRGKGNDYTAGKKDEDSLYNFREIAKMLDGAPITPYTIAMIYMLKHTFSLLTFAKTGKQESGEGLRGRHIDQANYTFLLNELVDEHVEIFKRKTE
jgi:hypothetical protein